MTTLPSRIRPTILWIMVSLLALISPSVVHALGQSSLPQLENHHLEYINGSGTYISTDTQFTESDFNLIGEQSYNKNIQIAQSSKITEKKNQKSISTAPSNSDEMRAVFLKLLLNPGDMELNLKYALLAEKRGRYETAIVTYERMALIDPKNNRWKQTAKRLENLMKPPETSFAIVLGARIDTNAAFNSENDGDKAGHNASLIVTLDDKRTIGDLKYQTTGQLYADYNLKDAPSDLILGALQFGPLVSVGERWQLRPALLFERSSLNRRSRDALSYSAGTLFNFENLAEGFINTIDVSLFHLGFFDESPGKDAIVLTANSGLLFDGFSEIDSITITPNVAFNRAKSGVGTDGFRDLYYEIGMDLTYAIEISENLEIAPILSYRYRDYLDYEPGGTTSRSDRNFIIGLETTVIDFIPDILILGNYSLERNKSFLATETYRNHSFGISFIRSF